VAGGSAPGAAKDVSGIQDLISVPGILAEDIHDAGPDRRPFTGTDAHIGAECVVSEAGRGRVVYIQGGCG
jgi:hypothetical protein